MKLVFISISVGYALFALIAYFGSYPMIFHPPQPGYGYSSELIELDTVDGEKIAAYYLPNQDAEYTILVSHGNAEDIGHLMPFLQKIHDHGFSVFAYDYHGYGLSSGKPDEESTYLDVDAAYDYLTKGLNIAPSKIISFGHSLGAAIALDLAVRKPVGAVILQGAFATAFRVVTAIPLLPFDKFNSLEKIKSLDCLLLVIHGKLDKIIPFRHGKKLYAEARVPKQFYEIKDAGHNNIEAVAGDKYWSVITDFIKLNLTKK